MPENKDGIETIVNIVLPLLTIIIPTGWSVIASIKNSIKSKGWLLLPKGADKYFFFCILIFSLAISFIISCILTIFNSILALVISLDIINKLIYYIFSCYLYISACKKLLQSKTVKLKLLKRRWSDILIIILPMLILFFIFNIYREFKWLSFLLYILFLVIEVIGLMRFSDAYFVYPYSYVNIYFTDGNFINQVDIDKIQYKHSWVIITKDNKEIRTKMDSITKAEYYGVNKIKLNSNKKI